MGIEKEIIEVEEWNFDTAAELIQLSKQLCRIPFGGGFDTLRPSEVSSRKGKEREVPSATSHLDGSPSIRPGEDIVSWLGNFPIQGKYRFWQLSFISFSSFRRPCLSYGTNSTDSNIRYMAGGKSPCLVWPIGDSSVRLPKSSCRESKGIVPGSLYGQFRPYVHFYRDELALTFYRFLFKVAASLSK